MPIIYFSGDVAARDYYSGDYIDGTIYLEDVKGVEARRLVLELIMERFAIFYDPTILDQYTVSHEIKDTEVVYTVEVHGRKKYVVDKAEYGFRIKIPDNVTPSLGWANSGVRWYLKATLDIPKSRDIVGKIALTVYNDVDLEGFKSERIFLKNRYVEVSLDKNLFEFRENIAGSFKILRLPSKLRDIEVCLKGDLKIRIKKMLLKTVKSTYYSGCVKYKPEEVRVGESYEFTIEPYMNRPITYKDKYIDSSVKLILKFNRMLARDINLEAPIIIYHSRREAIEESVKEALEKPSPAKELMEKIKRVMMDGVARDAVDLRLKLGFEYEPEEIIKACEKLVKEGYLEVVEKGMLLKKYRIRRTH